LFPRLPGSKKTVVSKHTPLLDAEAKAADRLVERRLAAADR
jgi:hypothetical protein